MRNFFRKLFRTVSHAPRTARRRPRPGVERLEERCTPANLDVDAAGVAQLIANPGELNDITLSLNQATARYEFTDNGAPITVLGAGAGPAGADVQGAGTTMVTAKASFLTSITIDTGDLADFVAIHSTAVPTSVTTTGTGDDNDTVTLGDAGSVQGITGPVNVTNVNALSSLHVDDSADATGRTATLSDTTISGLALADITYDPAAISDFTVNGGTAGNSFTVTNAIFNTTTTLNTGGGSDTINVQGTAAGSVLDINGQTGSDQLSVDFGCGSLSSAATINFHGGGQAGDTLLVVGLNVTTVTNTFLSDGSGTPHLGNVDVDGTVVNYDGVQPVGISGKMANLIVSLPTADGDNQAFLADNGSAGDNTGQIRSGNDTFETTQFTNPTTSLTINTGNDGETVTIDQSDSGSTAPLTVNGGTGDDTFNVTPNTNSTSATITINGDAPVIPPGDALNVNVAGTTDPTLNITNNNGGSLSGNYTFGNAGTVSFTSIESLSPTTADVGVTKSGPKTVTAGTNLTYTITVSDTGPLSAQNVQLTDVVPMNTTFVSESQTSGPAFSFSNPLPGGTGTVSGSIADLPAGSSATFRIVVHVNASAANGSTITNVANVSTTTTDPNSGNDSSMSMTTVVNAADVSVMKTAPATVAPGTNLTFTLTVRDNGPNNAQSVQLTDVVPPNTTFVSESQTSGPFFTFINPLPGGTGTVTGTISTLPAGSSATFRIVVHVNASATNGSTITNVANVSTTTPDPISGNNMSMSSTTVRTTADLKVSLKGTAVVHAGSNITYTLTVSNLGPNDAQGVQLTDTIPSGTTFVSLSQTSGPTFTFTNPLPGGTGMVSGNLDTLAAGSSATFVLVLNANASNPTGFRIRNTAQVNSSIFDPVLTNNTATFDTFVNVAPPL